MNISSKAEFKQLMWNRRNLYHFFARFFQEEVDEAFYESLKNVEFPLDRKENALTEFQDALQRLHEYFEYDAGESLDDLAADYAKTFLGAGNAQGEAAFPYESVYTSPKKVMMQEAWNQVCEIYDAKGIARNTESSDLMEDHISMEMEFMAYLCEETSQFTETLSGLEEQREFLNRHLLNWAPDFCLDIKYCADTEFYRMVGQLTTGFLQLDSFILDKMIGERKARAVCSKSYRISRNYMDEVLKTLQNEYYIYAPKRLPDRGMRENGGMIRYQEITGMEEIVTESQSDFSPKEIIYPIAQTLFSFDENSCRETLNNDPKGIIIFMRPCDINGLKRLDNMFLANGGIVDAYYKRMRDKVKIFMMECAGSWENCFCVSMGTNKSENYSIAWKLHGEDILLKIKDNEFVDYFEWAAECEYEPSFIEENQKKVNVPKIKDTSMLKEIFELDFWKKYNDECISCGGCNTVCPTCSCFDTIDFLNQENSRKGERRRIWSSCMLPDFSKTAGGNIARKYPEQMMRFKTMHKVYDYNARFGSNEHMCVGCGRCIQRCPEEISFSDTINCLSEEVNRLNIEKAADAKEEKGKSADVKAGKGKSADVKAGKGKSADVKAGKEETDGKGGEAKDGK